MENQYLHRDMNVHDATYYDLFSNDELENDEWCRCRYIGTLMVSLGDGRRRTEVFRVLVNCCFLAKLTLRKLFTLMLAPLQMFNLIETQWQGFYFFYKMYG